MGKQTELFKGDVMEEKLRYYFLSSGYYVVRGINYSFEDNLITDVDLFLYGRMSGMHRERTNVDIKNKKTPKAFERILWAKGLNNLLGFENCVVATTDRREVVRNYGNEHSVIVLDGNFLQKLRNSNESLGRISDEELFKLIDYKASKEFGYVTWRTLYENSKSRLLTELDFSGFNSTILLLNYFVKKCFDKQKKESAVRMVYLLISHSLLILDYILKDIAFLESDERMRQLNDGFKYGNIGRKGFDQIVDRSVAITGSRTPASVIKARLDTGEMDAFKEFFSKIDVIKKVFHWSLGFEIVGYSKTFFSPNHIDSELRGVISILLDYYKIPRKDFFNLYEKIG